MKKRSLIVSFILLIALVASICVVPMSSTSAEVKNNPYEIYVEFCKGFADRTPGSQGEKNAANYIAKNLNEVRVEGVNVYVGADGDTTTEGLLQSFKREVEDYNSETDEYENVIINSLNVVAYKRCGDQDAPLLVVAAPLSNLYGLSDSSQDSKNEGAYQSSSAVAVALAVAMDIKASKLDYDIAFLFYGADYYDNMGASYFFNECKQDILGVIDLYAIGGGDDLYLYCDEISTKHESFLTKRIKKFGYDIKSAPFNKNYFTNYNESSIFPYSHAGLYGIGDYVLSNGMPLVKLFGYSWDSFGDKESSSFDNVLGTTSDTFSYMDTNYGEEKLTERMDLAAVFVSGIVVNEEFKDTLEDYNQSYKGIASNTGYYAFAITALCILVTLFIVGAVYTSKKTKAAGEPDFSTNSSFLNGEENNNTEGDDDFDDDLFGSVKKDTPKEEKSEPSQENNIDDDDDIFGEF